jgi:anti-sigma factor RsiW
MSALLVGSASPRERLDVEGHAARCARCARAYRDLVATSVALSRAYAPLRGRAAALSPSRVRLAMRIPQPVPGTLRFSRLTARLNEIGLAAAVTAFAFAGIGSVAPEAQIVDDSVAPASSAGRQLIVSGDDPYFLRWLRIGRYVPPTGDILDAAGMPASAAQETQPTNERAGLLR